MVFLFRATVAPDVQFIGFYKIAPVAIFLTATGIEFVILDLGPGFSDLTGNHGFIFRSDDTVFVFSILLCYPVQ